MVITEMISHLLDTFNRIRMKMSNEKDMIMENELEKYISDRDMNEYHIERVKDAWRAALKAEKLYDEYSNKRLMNRPHAHP